MIPELGHYALILALLVALLQGSLPLFGAQFRLESWMALSRPAAFAQFVLVAFAFACLTASYLASDFSVLIVASHSHSLKPWLYKFAGSWGNHEGSLLLWAMILSLFGAAIALFGNSLPRTLRARILAVQAWIGTGFLLFTLFTSNPFTRLSPAPAEGNGLNPLLQDPGLAFHPPMLYVGYVGFSVAFSFAIAALIEGRVDPAWARWVRPWTLSAWIFLTGGIALGSWWAYYELGWGGWWFWDPVENASLMPWLAGTALLHSAIVVERRAALKSWTILLAILTFSLSLLGTFIVRSGVLTSVHAFAADPARGIFILGFLGLTIGGALALYAWRAPSLKLGGLFQPISREGALVVNNLLLISLCGTVFIGTLYPLFLDALSGEKISVGPPFFNFVFIALASPLLLVVTFGPLLAWKRGNVFQAWRRLRGLALIIGLYALGTVWILEVGSLAALLGLGLAGWVGGGALVEWAARIQLFRLPLAEALRRARALPRSAFGMTIAHLGIAVCLLGITVSEAWQKEWIGALAVGESQQVGPYHFRLVETDLLIGPNYVSRLARLEVKGKDGHHWELAPEIRRYETPAMETTEAAIHPLLSGDLYAVYAGEERDGRQLLRLYWKPLVSWIWFGALVMMLGGLISLSDRKHRLGAPRRSQTPTIPTTATAAETTHEA